MTLPQTLRRKNDKVPQPNTGAAKSSYLARGKSPWISQGAHRAPLVGIMKCILVLQWPAPSGSDYDALISMEEALEDRLDGSQSYVDGHDFGSSEMNLFVHTDQPLDAFEEAQSALGSDPRWAEVRAAYRPTDGEEYTIVWPATLEDFSVS